MSRVKLTDLIAPPFYKVHHAMRDGEYNSFWLKGGRASTKTSFAAIQVILLMMEDVNANAVVFRKVGNTLRASVMENLMWAIDKLGVSHLWDRTYAPAEITYKPTGQKILLLGLDDPLKIKSIKVKKGYFKIRWFEELAEFNGMEEIRNVQQSIMRGGDGFIEICSYNPPREPSSWVNVEAAKPVARRMVHESTYLEVPPEWLGREAIALAEDLKRTDEEAYNHEYLGIAVGRSQQIVFSGKIEVRDFETPPLSDMLEGRFFIGMDFGYAQDATAITRCFIMGKNLYIDQEAGGVGIEIEDLTATVDKVEGTKRWQILADSSRPETISYISRRGYNIEGVEKWEGNVEDAVEYMRGFERIVVHTRCPKTAAELKALCYKIDTKTQEILPTLAPRQQDHYFDSIRYALNKYIRKNVSILDVL